MIVKDLTENKYKGIKKSKSPNEITKEIYRAKFLQEFGSIDFLAKNLLDTLSGVDFDIIVPTNTTHSKVNLPERICSIISETTKVRLLKSGLQDKNKKASKMLKGKKVLIIDDVVYSGRTMRKCIAAVKKVKPEKIYFIAIAKSN